MPKPYPGESRKEYISRAIDYMVKHEGLDHRQAAGKAYGMWEKYIKDKK